MQILLNIVLGVFIVVALLMIFIILMQRPKSEGLGAAFGGGMTDNLFGAQTTNVLVKFTGWLAGLFFALTFLLSVLYAHRTTAASSGLRQQLMKDSAAASVPAASPAPSGAVGPPNTVTNPTPGSSEPAVTNAQPLTPADQAVGVTAPAPAPAASPVATASAKPKP